MDKKLFIIVPSVVVVLGLGVLTYAATRFNASDVSGATAYTGAMASSGNSGSQVAKSIAGADRTVTKVGVISCLKAKDPSVPQAGSCALGLYDGDGQAYGLLTDDPTLIGSLPSGQHIQVTGILKHPNTIYQTAGVISVQTLKQL